MRATAKPFTSNSRLSEGDRQRRAVGNSPFPHSFGPPQHLPGWLSSRRRSAVSRSLPKGILPMPQKEVVQGDIDPSTGTYPKTLEAPSTTPQPYLAGFLKRQLNQIVLVGAFIGVGLPVAGAFRDVLISGRGIMGNAGLALDLLERLAVWMICGAAIGALGSTVIVYVIAVVSEFSSFLGKRLLVWAERTVTSFELRLPWVLEELRRAKEGPNTQEDLQRLLPALRWVLTSAESSKTFVVEFASQGGVELLLQATRSILAARSVYSTPSSTTEEPPGSTAASTTAAIQALQLNGKPGYEDQAGRASANDATARLAVLLFCAMAAIADHPEGREALLEAGAVPLLLSTLPRADTVLSGSASAQEWQALLGNPVVAANVHVLERLTSQSPTIFNLAAGLRSSVRRAAA